MLPIWLESKGNCTKDFLQYQTPLPNVCTSYCSLFLLRVLKTVLPNCLYFSLVTNHHINMVELHFNFKIFPEPLTHPIYWFQWGAIRIGLISKGGKPRQQAVISASPVSSSQTEISAHFHLQMKIWEQEGIISHFHPTKCPSTIHSFNHVVLNIYIAIQCSD